MNLEKKFKESKEKILSGRWIHYENIRTLIEKLPEPLFSKEILGYSENNIPIDQIRIGNGPIKILLWSQMHGNESTATKSIFDIFNFLMDYHLKKKSVASLLKRTTLVFIPMLNPDGALAFTRENAHGIDLNRDASDLATAEAKILHNTVLKVQPDYAFNLHDQTCFHSVSETANVASLSFLAPAADVAVLLTLGRKKAMSVIVEMFNALQDYLPQRIGRYNDTYCDNCFGDNIQKMGFPTILIESGYFPDDPEREVTRKFHFIALISALFAISNKKIPDYSLYNQIPMNVKLHYDLRVDNVIYKGIKTSIGLRFAFKIEKKRLFKELDSDESIIYGTQLEGKFFHHTIDVKGEVFNEKKILKHVNTFL